MRATHRRAPVALAFALLAMPALAQQAPQQQPPQPRPAQAPPARAPAAATPLPAPPPAAPDRSWRVNCTETPATPPRNCQLSTAVMLQPQNRRIAQVVLMRQPQTRSLTLVFQMPHGALIPAGMSWQVDETPAQRLGFQHSDPGGLYAGLPVTDELLAALRRGTTLNLAFVVAAQRQQITLPVPLAQFDAAVTEFLATEQRAP